jgi:hypothetical protein
LGAEGGGHGFYGGDGGVRAHGRGREEVGPVYA